jgi:IS30 family transposase
MAACCIHQGRSYRKRYGYAYNRTGIPNRVDIDQRPEAVNNRLSTIEKIATSYHTQPNFLPKQKNGSGN